jgi:transketolase
LYPCDANQTAHLVATMAGLPGISYLRATRAKTTVIYPPTETFPIGGSKTLRRSDTDHVAIIAAGITLHESLRAYEQLKSEGILVRVIDAYSVKPIDAETLHEAARVTEGRLVVVEDHWCEGGLGDAILEVFADTPETPLRMIRLAVHAMPTSGTPAQLMNAAGIDAEHVAQAVRECL